MLEPVQYDRNRKLLDFKRLTPFIKFDLTRIQQMYASFGTNDEKYGQSSNH